MKSVVVFIIACAVALTSGTPTKSVNAVDLVKQKAILELFQHVDQNNIFPEWRKFAETLRIKEFLSFDYDYKETFTNVEAVMEFVRMYRSGMLHRGELFSIMNEKHRREAIAMFNVFYYAKNWETFYKVAIFAKFNINEGVFRYALTAAILHRKDMVEMVLPPPYEVYPYYFFNFEVVQKAQQYKMQGFYQEKLVDDSYTVVIPANYTMDLFETNVDSKLSYFMEDIGLNTYYYYFHMDYPFWMNGEHFFVNKNHRRGELYLYKHQQMLARFYLERLSNGMGVIPHFSWRKDIPTGYKSGLRYYNGVYFPTRDNFYNIDNEYNYDDIYTVELIESTIRDVIDKGYIESYDGIKFNLTAPESVELLGRFIQGTEEFKDKRFYGKLEYLTKMLLGTSLTTMHHYSPIPNVLEHFETAMRDPIFYQSFKRIINYVSKFKEHLPAYTHDDILFKGVTIEKVEVNKLETFFEKFLIDITNVVDIETFDETYTQSEFARKSQYKGKDIFIKASQYRLNHKPFHVRMNFISDLAQKVVVKTFLGPKYNEFGVEYKVNENRENFYELDQFVVDLVSGVNMIDRSCENFTKFIRDHTTSYNLYKDVMMGMKGETKFAYDTYEAHCGFPWRLMLPKGKKGGMVFQIFVFVFPYTETHIEKMTYPCAAKYGEYVDNHSYGYPLDREIDEVYWYTPNMYYRDVTIYHEHDDHMHMH